MYFCERKYVHDREVTPYPRIELMNIEMTCSIGFTIYGAGCRFSWFASFDNDNGVGGSEGDGASEVLTRAGKAEDCSPTSGAVNSKMTF